jgi:DNA-binding MarR family transcriptional regulator
LVRLYKLLLVQSKFEMDSITNRTKKTRLSMTLSDGLWQILARTDHLVAKARQKELRQYGLNMNDAIVLYTAIRLKNLASPTNISRQLFWEPHTVSGQLKAMEMKGLVRRTQDQKRHNLVKVEVTEKGIEAYRQSALRKSTRKAMSALTKEEQIKLWALLVKLRQKTMQMLELDDLEPFPPSDPAKL